MSHCDYKPFKCNDTKCSKNTGNYHDGRCGNCCEYGNPVTCHYCLYKIDPDKTTMRDVLDEYFKLKVENEKREKKQVKLIIINSGMLNPDILRHIYDKYL